jgi:hypothetical protein
MVKMKARRTVIAVGGALFALSAAALLDMRSAPAPEVTAARGDRLDVMEQASRCAGSSLIAACADDTAAATSVRSASMLQVFEKPNQTILVRVKLGD